MLEHSLVPFDEAAQHHFGIAVRLEAMAELLEFVPDLLVVIDLAVEGDGGVAVIGEHRLAALRDVENREAGRPERAQLALVRALLVWSSMANGIDQSIDAAPFDGVLKLGISCDATHKLPGYHPGPRRPHSARARRRYVNSW